MKLFSGSRAEGRDGDGGFIVKVFACGDGKGVVFSASASQALLNQSPNGFNWGYGGSGPSQLALGLLLEVTSDRNLSLRLYQQFKWEIVANVGDTWELSEPSILAWIAQQTK